MNRGVIVDYAGRGKLASITVPTKWKVVAPRAHGLHPRTRLEAALSVGDRVAHRFLSGAGETGGDRAGSIESRYRHADGGSAQPAITRRPSDSLPEPARRRGGPRHRGTA